MNTVYNLNTSYHSSDFQRVIADNIRAEAGRIGLRQKDIGAIVGITRASVGHKMKGVRAWSIEEIEILAGFFGLEPWQLCKPSEYEESRRKSAAHLSLLPRLDSNQRPSD